MNFVWNRKEIQFKKNDFHNGGIPYILSPIMYFIGIKKIAEIHGLSLFPMQFSLASYKTWDVYLSAPPPTSCLPQTRNSHSGDTLPTVIHVFKNSVPRETPANKVVDDQSNFSITSPFVLQSGFSQLYMNLKT